MRAVRGASARSAGALALAAAVSVLVTGCVPLGAGVAAGNEFEAALDAEFGDQVESVELREDDTVPFIGTAPGLVIVQDDTSPEVFAEIYEFVSTYTGARGEFEGIGVVANGVGVCTDDEHRLERQALRDALHDADASLLGEWACSHVDGVGTLAYQVTMEGLDDDIDLLHALAVGEGLSVEAQTHAPSGTVTGEWGELPETLGEAIEAATAHGEVTYFTFADDELAIGSRPTDEAAAAQAAVEAAVGPGVSVRLQTGD